MERDEGQGGYVMIRRWICGDKGETVDTRDIVDEHGASMTL